MIEVEDIKKRLKTLGYTATVDDDAFISFVLEKTYERVKNFINQNEIPEALKYEIIDDVCSNFMLCKLNTGSVNVEQAVQSIREGDTTVTFANGSDKTSWLKTYLTSLALDKSQLIRYRVMVW